MVAICYIDIPATLLARELTLFLVFCAPSLPFSTQPAHIYVLIFSHFISPIASKRDVSCALRWSYIHLAVIVEGALHQMIMVSRTGCTAYMLDPDITLCEMKYNAQFLGRPADISLAVTDTRMGPATRVGRVQPAGSRM